MNVSKINVKSRMGPQSFGSVEITDGSSRLGNGSFTFLTLFLFPMSIGRLQLTILTEGNRLSIVHFELHGDVSNFKFASKETLCGSENFVAVGRGVDGQMNTERDAFH